MIKRSKVTKIRDRFFSPLNIKMTNQTIDGIIHYYIYCHICQKKTHTNIYHRLNKNDKIIKCERCKTRYEKASGGWRDKFVWVNIIGQSIRQHSQESITIKAIDVNNKDRGYFNINPDTHEPLGLQITEAIKDIQSGNKQKYYLTIDLSKPTGTLSPMNDFFGIIKLSEEDIIKYNKPNLEWKKNIPIKS